MAQYMNQLGGDASTMSRSRLYKGIHFVVLAVDSPMMKRIDQINEDVPADGAEFAAIGVALAHDAVTG
jgi:hypothetical protein